MALSFNINLDEQKVWLITGCAGFIGSNLIEFLLKNNQKVVGLDNFSTGYQRNLDDVRDAVNEKQWQRFTFIDGDICDFDTCVLATTGVDIVLQQAALGSVPRSIKDPVTSHETNVTGFVNMLKASVDNKVKRFVYASSSSVYGDSPDLPKQESKIGNQLSPYAVTKYACELYANVFARTYGLDVIGLRYFNVFGRRQDPDGAYAAVIPLWFKSILNNQPPIINGNGETSRDFCYIDNVIQMNVLCGLSCNKDSLNRVYNVACGEQTSLNQLFSYIRQLTNADSGLEPIYRDFRAGDILHSLADISAAKNLIGYNPSHSITEGLAAATQWYRGYFSKI